MTLLEVLGAVVILGLVGVSVITSSMDSSLDAAHARDLLTASLLADDALAELETRAAAGGIPLGTQETERDGFRIAVTTAAADVGALLAARQAGDRELGPATLFQEPRSGRPALLELRVDVSLSGEVVTQRTSFAFDPTASSELQALAPEEDEGAPE